MTPIEEITLDELKALVEKSEYTEYGLPVIEYDGCEYLIALDEEEAFTGCKEYIEGSAWAFNAGFLAQETNMPIEIFELYQEKGICDSANDMCLACIEYSCGLDAFVESAIHWDGRGHFLSCWDGKELELDCGAYAYRIN